VRKSGPSDLRLWEDNEEIQTGVIRSSYIHSPVLFKVTALLVWFKCAWVCVSTWGVTYRIVLAEE